MTYKLTIPGEPVAKGEWNRIPGFEEYFASKTGEIYSTITNRVLKQAKTKDGYLKVTLFKERKGTTKKTHRFVALAFLPNPINKPQINHKNGDKKDNRIENLEWVMPQENIDHAVRYGLINSEKAKMGYEIKLAKYGREYISEIGRKNGLKSDSKKAQKTRIERYGVDGLKKIAKAASDKARGINVKSTVVIDIYTNNTIGIFNSRIEAAEKLGVNARRISESILNGRVLKNKFIAKEVGA